MYPVLSIVTPSFNQGQYIEKTIQSVLRQKGDFVIDYIIIDGGSTDNSIDVIKKYETLLTSGKWPLTCKGISYRWYSEPDKGQSDAINKGFRMAKGDLIAWLNSDDYYTDDALAIVSDAFRDNASIAMLYADGYLVDKSGSIREEYHAAPFFDLWKLIHLYDFILQPSVFMSRKALEQAGPIEERLEYIMDWELWIRLSRFGRAVHLNKNLSYARAYSENKTQSAGMKRWNEIRWCTQKYGHKLLPPVIFTQLFHRPAYVGLKLNSNYRETRAYSIIQPIKKMYYHLIRDNSSGLYEDGYMKRLGCITIPLRKDLASVSIEILPICRNSVRYSINNRPCETVQLLGEAVTIKITLTDEMREREFLHVTFVSNKSVPVDSGSSVDAGRTAAFKIGGISVKDTRDGDVVNLGLPEFLKETP